MDDGPAIFLGHCVTEWRVSSNPKSYRVKELSVRLHLHVLALQVRGQRVKALPNGAIALPFGSVAHDTKVTISPLSLIDGCPVIG